jgi:hypothetical protein
MLTANPTIGIARNAEPGLQISERPVRRRECVIERDRPLARCNTRS